VNFLLPRGKVSSVPEAVAREIARAERARDALEALKNDLQEAAK